MLKQRQATLYSLYCDNCGMQHEGDGFDEFFDEDELYDDATDYSSWCGLYKGKKEPPEGKDHLSYAEQHFCCEACREKWLKRRRFKKDFRSVSGGDAGGGPLSARDVGSAPEFHDAAGGGTPQPVGSFSDMK